MGAIVGRLAVARLSTLAQARVIAALREAQRRWKERGSLWRLRFHTTLMSCFARAIASAPQGLLLALAQLMRLAPAAWMQSLAAMPSPPPCAPGEDPLPAATATLRLPPSMSDSHLACLGRHTLSRLDDLALGLAAPAPNALTYVVRRWCHAQDDIHGDYSLKVRSVAHVNPFAHKK